MNLHRSASSDQSLRFFEGTRFDFMDLLGYEGFKSCSVASANDIQHTLDIESDRPEASVYYTCLVQVTSLLAQLRIATSYIYLLRLQLIICYLVVAGPMATKRAWRE